MNQKRGEEFFEAWYKERFKSRWEGLKQALRAPVRQVALSEGLLRPYFLDAGSVEAVSLLPVIENARYLDLCAAPGGKSLYIATTLLKNSFLTCNEFSRERKARLHKVITEHLPEAISTKIQITGHDASRWSRYEKDAFDCILLDAPCSSERHVLNSPAHLAEWTPARIKNLAQRQWSLLSGAYLVLKTGGYLLYSTCALSYEENDGQIERLLKKYSNVSILQVSRNDAFGEKTKFGFHVLPDSSEGAGPIYYALIKKS